MTAMTDWADVAKAIVDERRGAPYAYLPRVGPEIERLLALSHDDLEAELAARKMEQP